MAQQLAGRCASGDGGWRRRCRQVQAFLVPDISIGKNEAPEFAAMARKAVSTMSLEEVLGRMVVEIAVVWVLSGMVRALVDKFGDAAQKVTSQGLAATVFVTSWAGGLTSSLLQTLETASAVLQRDDKKPLSVLRVLSL